MIKIIIIILSFFYLPLSSEPYFEFGAKTTRFITEFVASDYWGNDIWIFEPYWGVNAEVLINLLGGFYLRMEIIEVRKYAYSNGLRFKFFSNLSADVEYIPLNSRRLSPLVYIGIKYGRFNNSSLYGPSDVITNHEFHIGAGFVYRLNRKYKIVFESLVYTDNKFWFYDFEPDAPWQYRIQTIGFEKISLGLRCKT